MKDCQTSHSRFLFLPVSLPVSVSLQPDVVVHCAAERRPDVVERHTEAAFNLNVHATGTLAKEAGRSHIVLGPEDMKEETQHTQQLHKAGFIPALLLPLSM